MSIVTQVVSSRHQSVAKTDINVQLKSALARLYFHMQLIESTSPDQTEDVDTMMPVDAVEPNKSYVLQVWADPDCDYRTSERSVTMYSDIELYIRSQHPLINAQFGPHRVKCDQAWGMTCEFEVKVDPRYVDDRVVIELLYRRAGRHQRPIPVSQLTLQGRNDWSEEQALPRYIVLAPDLSDGVRILHVRPETETTLHVRSYWEDAVEFHDILIKPTLSPARFMRQEHQPQDILDRIRERSADNPTRFEHWLRKNYLHHGDRFCLIILDDSDEYDMAWELIHIHVEENEKVLSHDLLRGEVPIGALFPIVRWIPGLKYHGNYVPLAVSESLLSGDVVAYLDPVDTSYIDVEKRMLSRYRSHPVATIQALKRYLERPLLSTALIYLGCHGRIIVENDREQEFILGSLSPQQQITVYGLAGLGYRDTSGPRPIAIVNACHSAYSMRKDQLRYGLPITMLRRIARDFLGTIGPVDSEFAANFISTLLANAAAEDGIRLAVALMEKRVEAFRRMKQNTQDPKVWFDYLFTFMYVYYGNPFTSLHLLPSGPGLDEVNACNR